MILRSSAEAVACQRTAVQLLRSSCPEPSTPFPSKTHYTFEQQRVQSTSDLVRSAHVVESSIWPPFSLSPLPHPPRNHQAHENTISFRRLLDSQPRDLATTQSSTRSSSVTVTLSRTTSPSRSASRTDSHSLSFTKSGSSSVTVTSTATATDSTTDTSSSSESLSDTCSVTVSSTVSHTSHHTLSVSASASRTRSLPPSVSYSDSLSSSDTATATDSISESSSATQTPFYSFVRVPTSAPVTAAPQHTPSPVFLALAVVSVPAVLICVVASCYYRRTRRKPVGGSSTVGQRVFPEVGVGNVGGSSAAIV